MRLGRSELHWFRLSARSRLEIADAMATLLLGIGLCAGLLAFTAFQLGAADWAPEVHGLSEEGKYFVSLSLAGMRVHEVESGKEIDRILLRSPWENLWTKREQDEADFHPFDSAAEDGWDTLTFYDLRQIFRNAVRPHLVMSHSGRYVAGQFPAGYALLWDRSTGRFRAFAEPGFYFDNLWIDEERGWLAIEALEKPKEKVLFDDEREPEGTGDPHAIDLIYYRLGDFQRDRVEKIANAGRRINNNRNLRAIDDHQKRELRVLKCQDFPFDSREVIHRISHNKADWTELPYLRMVDDDLYLAKGNSWQDDDKIEFYKSRPLQSGQRPVIRRLPLAKDVECSRWFANGYATFEPDWYILAIWDRDQSVVAYSMPNDSDVYEGVTLGSEVSGRIVRVAGEYGEVIDFPVAKKGQFVRRRVDLSAYPKLTMQMTAAIGGALAAWSVWAYFSGGIFRQRGWSVLLLALCWPLTFLAIKGLSQSAEQGFLFLGLTWLLFAVLATIGAIGLLGRRRAWRSGVVLVCAILVLIVLSEIPSRFHIDSGAVFSPSPTWGAPPAGGTVF